jgi:hypothetical protein
MTVLITQLIEPSVGEGKYLLCILMAASVEKLMYPVHNLWNQKFGEGGHPVRSFTCSMFHVLIRMCKIFKKRPTNSF